MTPIRQQHRAAGKWVRLVKRLALLPDGPGWQRVGKWGGPSVRESLKRALGDRFVFASRAGVLYAKRREP